MQRHVVETLVDGMVPNNIERLSMRPSSMAREDLESSQHALISRVEQNKNKLKHGERKKKGLLRRVQTESKIPQFSLCKEGKN